MMKLLFNLWQLVSGRRRRIERILALYSGGRALESRLSAQLT
jgi:hypothetical protein